MYSDSKKITGVTVLSKNGAGALLQHQFEKEGTNVWKDIGTVDENYASLFPNAETSDFNISRFRLKGNTRGTPMVFDGIEILKLSDEGLNNN
jgi:hypothetical protein